jgi:hypothetical protein
MGCPAVGAIAGASTTPILQAATNLAAERFWSTEPGGASGSEYARITKRSEHYASELECIDRAGARRYTVRGV